MSVSTKTLTCPACSQRFDMPYWSGRKYCDDCRPNKSYQRLLTDEQVVEAMRRGGQNSNSGGFASHPELAREAGRKGGTLSRRKKR